MQETDNPGYDISGMAMHELIWGKGFIAPGGEGNVDRIVGGVDLEGKQILELGSGIGGGAITLARKYGARVIGLEYAQITGPLFEKMAELGDAEARDHFIEEWRAMLVVLDSGELKSGYFRGRKP